MHRNVFCSTGSKKHELTITAQKNKKQKKGLNFCEVFLLFLILDNSCLFECCWEKKVSISHSTLLLKHRPVSIVKCLFVCFFWEIGRLQNGIKDAAKNATRFDLQFVIFRQEKLPMKPEEKDCWVWKESRMETFSYYENN